MSETVLRIERFRPEDQAAVRQLVLAGLVEHWGALDPGLNPDLDDIGAAYADGTVLVAWFGDEIVGTGTVMPRSANTYEAMRMSVAKPHRRRGIGVRMLDEIVAVAATAGARRLVLETTTAWTEVVAFYLAYGFAVTHELPGDFGPDTYFALDLVVPPD